MKEERISKIIARRGYCSRRAAEELISSGVVKINNIKVETLGTKANHNDIISIHDKIIDNIQRTRLWMYNKPMGLITSHKDEKNRKTVFEELPKNIPRVVSIGRLDYNSEGILLLTNNGELARFMEMPNQKFVRKYRVRVFGDINNLDIDKIKSGIKIDNIQYRPVEIELDRSKNNNSWFELSIYEGKNREIRRIFEHFGLKVNRLIRIKYGIFDLNDLPLRHIKEIDQNIIKDKLNFEI